MLDSVLAKQDALLDAGSGDTSAVAWASELDDPGPAVAFSASPDHAPVKPALADPGEAPPAAIELARELGLSITLADVLHRAGRCADDDTRGFLEPRLSQLTPPDLMADRDESAARIARAIRARERICVFGDYDCDGITATAVLTGVIRALGGESAALLATRLEGSYGLSWPAWERVRALRPGLLITCDCGSSDHERLAAARAAGVDVIVIDHHLVPSEPLPALAFLNPHRPDCRFPFKGLASCGLALSIAAAVRRNLSAQLDLRRWLDLVAIGTVADVVPLTGDNRALVRAGLGVIAGGGRPGLRALWSAARIDPACGVTAEDVAFRIAPRLNAPGRLGDPDLALSLLLAADPATATGIAATIEQITERRKAIQAQMLADAIAEIDAARFGDAPGIVLARQGWHPGIVGIVAGRIASRYGKPTIVVALEGSSGRGSVRGPSGFRLYDALARARGELAGFGGHQAAAGVEVRADRVEALRDLWCEACSAMGSAADVPAEVEADVRLDDRDEPIAVVRDLGRLEPCGEANRAPRVFIAGAGVRSARNLKGHLKLELTTGRHAFGAFGYELGALADSVSGGRVHLVGRLRRDSWRGGDAVELRIDRVVPA